MTAHDDTPRIGDGTQKIGFFGQTPVEPATLVTYEGPHYAKPGRATLRRHRQR